MEKSDVCNPQFDAVLKKIEYYQKCLVILTVTRDPSEV